MAYAVVLIPRARKQLNTLDRQPQSRIINALTALAADPYAHTVKLKGSDRWRIRVGDYRVVYIIDDDAHTVTITRIMHRRDVYENR